MMSPRTSSLVMAVFTCVLTIGVVNAQAQSQSQLEARSRAQSLQRATIASLLETTAAASPNRMLLATIAIKPGTTLAELVQLTEVHEIVSMQIEARQFIKGDEGVFTSLDFSSLVSTDQQTFHGKCSLARAVGFFSYSSDTAAKVREDLPNQGKGWWFAAGLITTTAADLLRLAQAGQIVVTNASFKGPMPESELAFVKKTVLKKLSATTCATE